MAALRVVLDLPALVAATSGLPAKTDLTLTVDGEGTTVEYAGVSTSFKHAYPADEFPSPPDRPVQPSAVVGPDTTQRMNEEREHDDGKRESDVEQNDTKSGHKRLDVTSLALV